MEPVYMNENRYSYLVGSLIKPVNTNYVVQSPESSFEQYIQNLIVQGQNYLQQEEYSLALNSFTEAMAAILKTVHPTMPVDPNLLKHFTFPNDITLVDTLINKTAEMLEKTSPVSYSFPSDLISTQSVVSAQVQKLLSPVSNLGLQITSYDAAVTTNVNNALNAVKSEDWAGAIQYYTTALKAVPATDLLTQGSLQHDLAILNEKAGDITAATSAINTSIDLLTKAKVPEAEATALSTASGIYSRSGNTQQAQTLSTQLDKLQATVNLNTISTAARTATLSTIKAAPITRTVGTTPIATVTGAGPVGLAGTVAGATPIVGTTPIAAGTVVGTTAAGTTAAGATAAGAATTSTTASLAQAAALQGSLSDVTVQASLATNIIAPQLLGLSYVSKIPSEKDITINGYTSTASIQVNGSTAASAKNFLTTLAATNDIGLLKGFITPQQTVAYLPHMYFYIIPMCMADCYSGLGNLAKAITTYQSVLSYPYINANYEIIKVWTRLAQAYLDSGDLAYRNARDTVANFAQAKASYEDIVMTDKTLNAGSPLYSNAKFAGIKTRVTTALAAADPSTVNDNPLIISIVVNALTKLQQIQQGFNFFGFSQSYLPPFSFEYLQNTARYFAQQASTTEQRYIQYKSQAESAQFQRNQMDQQAQVAAQSVILEQRNVAEAQAGINVAQQGLNYANVQLNNDIASKNDFANTRWEDLDLSDAEAWANASAVDHDDEVQLTWNGNYYSSDHKPRNQVLQDLNDKRTRLSQDLEANRLDRAVASSQAYIGVAQAQLADAQARMAIAQQRVVVAQLQQKYAEDNRDFLDMEEFSAGLWYELAQQAEQLMQRYLDMATEIAFLMERAYNAETERGLHVIRYDYQHTSTDNLMGADQLALDIDYFTFDNITTTTTKKIPVKRTISLADAFPMAFQSLKTTGLANFETTLADFDRFHPGFYLAKTRNVELLFVGIAGATSIAGTLRNVGVSKFRLSDGSIVTRLYPADVMVLSQYQIRQDSLAYRVDPKDLRLFENNGIDTLWQLSLPQSANDFDFSDILDIQLIFYYDGFFDPALETSIKAALPANGSASKVISLQLSYPDELFYLRNQGNANLVIDATMFPYNQKDLTRKDCTIKLSGTATAIQNVTVHIKSTLLPNEIIVKTDANGQISDAAAGSSLATLRNLSMFDTWQVSILALDNPQLVQSGKLDLSGITDLIVFSDYLFNYK